ncbi:MAG TPA: PAS domain S-box protein [Coleofasciculaceae cyanobacterium]
MNLARPPRRILLIDSHPGDRALTLQALIQEFPWVEVEEIFKPEQLTPALAAKNFDLIITDYELPWTTGLEVLQTLGRSCDRPVIMFAGCDNLEMAVAAMKAGLEDYIVKSADNLPRLLQAVSEVWQKAPPVTQTARALPSQPAIKHLHTHLLGQTEPGYSDLLNSISSIVWEYDPQTCRFTFVSQPAEPILGYPLAQWLEPDFWVNHLHPEDREGALQSCLTAQLEQRNHRFEYRMIAAAGHTVWIEDIVTVVVEDHQLVKLVGLMIDISDRKQIEAALAQEMLRRTALLNTSVDGIVILDQSGDVIEANPSFAQMLGYSLAETHTLNLKDFDVQWAEAEFDPKMVDFNFCKHTFQTRHRRQDGSIYEVEISSNNVEWDGQLAHVCICRDITDRKAAEAALQESEERFREIANTIPQLFLVRSLHPDRFLYVSPAYETIWGRSREALMQNPQVWMEAIHPDDLPHVQASVAAQMQGNPVQREYRIIRPDGAVRWISAEIMVVYDAAGTPVRFVGLAEDITKRKHLEIALQASEARLRDVLDHADAAIVSFRLYANRDWEHNYYSAGCESVYGYTSQELMADTYLWRSRVLPEDWKTIEREGFDQFFAGRTGTLEYRFRHKNGSLRWMMESYTSRRDETANCWVITTVSRDISDRKVVEHCLQQLNQELEQRVAKRTTQLRLALSVARMGTWEWDMVTHLETWSLENYNLLGFYTDNTGRVLDENGVEISPVPTHELFLQRLHPDDRERVTQALLQALQARSAYECEFQVVHWDGSIHWCYTRGAYILNDQGQPIRMIGISMDVTDRKQTEAALRESETRFRATFNQAAVGVAHVALDGRWLEVNQKLCDLVGYTPSEFLERTVQELTYPEDLETDLSHVRQLLAGECETYSLEKRYVHKDGFPVWTELTVSLMRELGPLDLGTPKYFIAVIQDISDRKQAEAAIRHQVRQEHLLRLVTQEIRQSLDLDATLSTAVTEVRQTLQADRVAVYRFNPDWSGNFIAESVGAGWANLVDPTVVRVWEDTHLQETQGGRYKNHENFAVSDIYTVGHRTCHIALLEQFQARAYAIAPIFSGGQLWGLLAIYQNSAPRHWQAWEMDLLKQIADQLAIAIQQSELYRQLQAELRERQQMEEQLRNSLKEKEVLLREVYHRVKNNMQMVSSLLHLQSGSVDDPAVLKLLRESQQRVKTMSLIHERLYRSNNLAHINAAKYIRDLVNNVVRSYTSTPSAIRVILDLADLELDLDTAVPCGLIINELVSNALKYAFPHQQGEIKLQFWLEGTENYCLIVQDDGIGIPAHVDPQQTDSLGMQLVYGLTEQLGGKIELDRQAGSRFKVTFRKKISAC